MVGPAIVAHLLAFQICRKPRVNKNCNNDDRKQTSEAALVFIVGLASFWYGANLWASLISRKPRVSNRSELCGEKKNLQQQIRFFSGPGHISGAADL